MRKGIESVFDRKSSLNDGKRFVTYFNKKGYSNPFKTPPELPLGQGSLQSGSYHGRVVVI